MENDKAVRPALPLFVLLALASALGVAVAIALAGVTMLLAAPAYAGEGNLLLERPGGLAQAERLFAHSESLHEGHTRVVEIYHNSFAEPLAGVYVVRLPQNTVVERLTLTRGDAVSPRQALLTLRQGAALLERAGQLGAGETLRVELEYWTRSPRRAPVAAILSDVADDKRRGFLKMQLGGGAAFGVGLLTGGALGAAGMRAHLVPPFSEDAELSYAQQGEDLILWSILHQFLGLSPITYLDVGAHHPVKYNNTYLFYQRGYRGVLVEPNPDLWDLLAGVRPRDVLIRGGIGIEGRDTEADYYVVSDDHGRLNTFSKEMAESYTALSSGRISVKQVLRLPLLDINGVMQRSWGGAPHLLSIDTEGFELPILQAMDWKAYRPAVVCVDTLEVATRRQRLSIHEIMVARGYDVRGATFVNTIFVDRRYL